ncbi:serine/threonine-protein kinase [Mycobacterium lacus]|nr:serine/threonine-protein kinase [Mycobacterium lacus]
MLWAAGVLGALAIIIAVLIVINHNAETQPQQPPPTVTQTPPASQTSTGQGPRLNWTDRGETGNPGRQSKRPEANRAIEPSSAVPLTPHRRASLARYETPR